MSHTHYLGIAERHPLIFIKSEMVDNHRDISYISHQLMVGEKLRFTA
ncbi:MAG: hypothetical protein ACSLEN_14030 [Candidatus Malihini olakiniferum]